MYGYRYIHTRMQMNICMHTCICVQVENMYTNMDVCMYTHTSHWPSSSFCTKKAECICMITSATNTTSEKTSIPEIYISA